MCTQGAPSLAQKVLAFQQAFWKFLRPHTIRGTILGSCAVTAKAVLENPQVRSVLLKAWTPSIQCNQCDYCMQAVPLLEQQSLPWQCDACFTCDHTSHISVP